MRVTEDTKLDFSDVLLVPKRSELNSRSEVEVTREFKFKHSSRELKCCPIIASNMYNTGTFAMADALSKRDMLTFLHKHYSPQDWKTQTTQNKPLGMIGYTLGIGEDEYKKFAEIAQTIYLPSLVCIDVPNGYIPKVSDTIKRIRHNVEDKVIIAVGNVVTPNLTEQLILDGADIVKIGIGSGGLCTTRLVAGVGYPQLSAIAECGDAAHGLGGHIISDGGITCIGDISKAFCAGADFVMIGGLFTGYDENEGEWITTGGSKYTYIQPDRQHLFRVGMQMSISLDGSDRIATHQQELDETWKIPPRKSKLKVFGMSSKAANDKFSGGLKDYRAAEGRETSVACKGPVSTFLQEVEGGLRSCGSYIGATRIKDFPKCATFCRVTRTHNKLFEGTNA